MSELNCSYPHVSHVLSSSYTQNKDRLAYSSRHNSSKVRLIPTYPSDPFCLRSVSSMTGSIIKNGIDHVYRVLHPSAHLFSAILFPAVFQASGRYTINTPCGIHFYCILHLSKLCDMPYPIVNTASPPRSVEVGTYHVHPITQAAPTPQSPQCSLFYRPAPHPSSSTLVETNSYG